MIDVTDLTYIQNGKPLLNGVSFRLYNGKRYGVSGEGAAELLGVLAGSLACSAGRVRSFRRSDTGAPRWRLSPARPRFRLRADGV